MAQSANSEKSFRVPSWIGLSIFALAGLAIGSFIYADIRSAKDIIYVDTSDDSPVSLIGGGGERIYLRFGQIYAVKDDPEKEYRIVNGVVHVTKAIYKKLLFFDLPEEAEAAGFKPAEDFAKDYVCVQEGKDSWECRGSSWGSSGTPDGE